MTFQSLHFLVFAIVVFAANALLLRNLLWRKKMLLAASYYFYLCWDWRFASLLLAVAAVNYFASYKIELAQSLTNRKGWLFFALLICLGVLAYFKYFNFFVGSAVQLLESIGLHVEIPTLTVLLPIGISFFTFQGLSYTIDVYFGRQKRDADFWDFALFIAFFPTVLSGPITRGRQLLEQFKKPEPYRAETAQQGLFLVLKGLIKKNLFADVLALHIVTPAFSEPSEYNSGFLIVAVVAYSFQIYMDLSGYTDIVRGISKTLGFELPENFNRPYQASSVSNFWQRWHITMSSFFRDYLYFGLGGSKVGNVYVNLLITFVAIGIWHGAGWNFIVYGLCHGTVVALERFFRHHQADFFWLRALRTKTYVFGTITGTFAFVALSRILFRSKDIDSAVKFFEGLIFSAGGYAPYTLMSLTVLSGAIILHFIPKVWSERVEGAFIRSSAWIQAHITVSLFIVLTALSNGQSAFVYFQF